MSSKPNSNSIKDPFADCSADDNLQPGESMAANEPLLKVMVWSDGKITFWGEHKAIQRFIDGWLSEGLPVEHILNLCG